MLSIKILTCAARMPHFTHPILFKPLMKYHLWKLDFNMKWAFRWRDDMNYLLRVGTGYDLCIDGGSNAADWELYIWGAHRQFFKGFINGHKSFVAHRAALMTKDINPYTITLKLRACVAVVRARSMQDVYVTASWKHTLNGLLWGSLITMLMEV